MSTFSEILGGGLQNRIAGFVSAYTPSNWFRYRFNHHSDTQTYSLYEIGDSRRVEVNRGCMGIYSEQDVGECPADNNPARGWVFRGRNETGPNLTIEYTTDHWEMYDTQLDPDKRIGNTNRAATMVSIKYTGQPYVQFKRTSAEVDSGCVSLCYVGGYNPQPFPLKGYSTKTVKKAIKIGAPPTYLPGMGKHLPISQEKEAAEVIKMLGCMRNKADMIQSIVETALEFGRTYNKLRTWGGLFYAMMPYWTKKVRKKTFCYKRRGSEKRRKLGLPVQSTCRNVYKDEAVEIIRPWVSVNTEKKHVTTGNDIHPLDFFFMLQPLATMVVDGLKLMQDCSDLNRGLNEQIQLFDVRCACSIEEIQEYSSTSTAIESFLGETINKEIELTIEHITEMRYTFRAKMSIFDVTTHAAKQVFTAHKKLGEWWRATRLSWFIDKMVPISLVLDLVDLHYDGIFLRPILFKVKYSKVRSKISLKGDVQGSRGAECVYFDRTVDSDTSVLGILGGFSHLIDDTIKLNPGWGPLALLALTKIPGISSTSDPLKYKYKP